MHAKCDFRSSSNDVLWLVKHIEWNWHQNQWFTLAHDLRAKYYLAFNTSGAEIILKCWHDLTIVIFQYPLCQSIDLWDYFDFHEHAPLRIDFYMNADPNIGVTLHIEERNRLTFRTLKSNMLSYNGPELKISNISVSYEVRSVLVLIVKSHFHPYFTVQ